jgi:hypothetical protein
MIVIQVFNPDALKNTSACLSNDKCVAIIAMANPVKFGHDHYTAIASQLALSIAPESEEPEEQVQQNYIFYVSTASSKAVEHLTVEDSDISLALKKVYCVFPPDAMGSNDYFIDDESAFLLLAPFLTATCSPPLF